MIEPMKEIFRLPLIICLLSCSLFGQNLSADAPKLLSINIGFNLVFSGEFDDNAAYLLSISGPNFKPAQITR